MRIGVLPDENAESLKKRYRPLQDYLAVQIGIPCELVVPDSYDHLIQLFHNHKVDIANFGGLTFLKTMTTYGALPLVSRDVDHEFTSYVLVRAKLDVQRLEDTRGLRFSFGAKLSTSGHLRPRHFLMERGIQPETFYAEVFYSGTHDRTATNIRDGVADIGVANARVIDRMFANGSLSHDDVRVLWQTPPYADYVWAIQEGIATDERLRIRDAFFVAFHGQTRARVDSRSFRG